MGKLNNIELEEYFNEEQRLFDFYTTDQEERDHVVDKAVHKDYINGEQYEELLDGFQEELLFISNRSSFQEGCLQAITLCIGMMGLPAYIQESIDTYDEVLKKHSERLGVAT